jgi:hypothetical protein
MGSVRSRTVFAMSSYLLAVLLLAFGISINPHTWSAWWVRNGGWLFNCQMGWSVAAKLVPAVLVALVFTAASSVPSAAGRVLRWGALPLLLVISVTIAVTWPAEGCPPISAA